MTLDQAASEAADKARSTWPPQFIEGFKAGHAFALESPEVLALVAALELIWDLPFQAHVSDASMIAEGAIEAFRKAQGGGE